MLAWWIKFRTSMLYVWVFALIIAVWISLNKLGFVDNRELSNLNITLSVMAELQSVLLLVYMGKMAAKQERAEQQQRKDIKAILKAVSRRSI